MTARVLSLPRAAGRGRQSAAAEQIVDLELELIAMQVERTALASEMLALSRRIQLAIHADRPDVALHVAGRLDALAASLTRRGAA
jgi:hypothetical protein